MAGASRRDFIEPMCRMFSASWSHRSKKSEERFRPLSPDEVNDLVSSVLVRFRSDRWIRLIRIGDK